MQGVLGLLAVWGLVGVAVCTAVDALREQTAWAGRVSAGFAAERRALACGRRAVYKRNLTDAAALLSQLAPSNGAAYRRAAASALGDAAADEGPCALSDDVYGLVIGAHKQLNPLLPPAWPNWVVRYERAERLR